MITGTKSLEAHLGTLQKRRRSMNRRKEWERELYRIREPYLIAERLSLPVDVVRTFTRGQYEMTKQILVDEDNKKERDRAASRRKSGR